MHTDKSLREDFRGYQGQGSIEISAPGALYAVDFRRAEEKIRSELLPPARGQTAPGIKSMEDEIKKRRRETVHRTGQKSPRAGPAFADALRVSQHSAHDR